MRQSQQERRIAVQLLQTRHEKEVIRKNRVLREKMYEERRLKDFEEALNREAVSLAFSVPYSYMHLFFKILFLVQILVYCFNAELSVS